jgi:hypothetical protein
MKAVIKNKTAIKTVKITDLAITIVTIAIKDKTVIKDRTAIKTVEITDLAITITMTTT